MKQEYDFSNSERGKFFRADFKLRFPTIGGQPNWVGSGGSLAKFVVEEAEKTLGAYRVQPKLITRDANEEHDTAHGGYAERQLFELVQNSADALREAPMGKSILIRLTKGFLYCADNGNPIDERGIDGLMFARMSSKRNTGAIGRFGLGFKSVLRVTDSPEFYSRPGSFRFDGPRSAKRIAGVASAERYPVLSLPEPIDPHKAKDTDEELRELMSWATNIVRLPLKPDAYGNLEAQITNFPPEFLLLVDHVRYLTLEKAEAAREFVLEDRQGERHLDTGEGLSRWRRFETAHRVSLNARSDWPLHGDSGDVPIRWAVPLDRLDRPGHFWAFFPTKTASLVTGILNASWKTNEDRQNLLPGPYNDELIEATAGMIAENLHILATPDDPARHLDALPRREESGDTEQSVRLRECLLSHLEEREIVPDQDGKLRPIREISYPPKALTDGADRAPLERWAAYSARPSDWLHLSALTRNRLASIDRLFPPQRILSGYRIYEKASAAPRATIAKWLEALVEGKEGDDAVQASMAAIWTAAAIPLETRSKEKLGDIILTASGGWRPPDPDRLVLPDGSPNSAVSEPDWCVHSELASDRDTLTALEALDLKPASPETVFRNVAERVLSYTQKAEPRFFEQFWVASRALTPDQACAMVRQFAEEKWPGKLHARAQSGSWRPLYEVLLPGDIVPGDGSRDDTATVDTQFHACDVELLRALGVTPLPQDSRDLSSEPWFSAFRSNWRSEFLKRDLPRNPQRGRLKFASTVGSGPLNVLTVLSDRGRALYTNALLLLDAAYEPWTMEHDTQDIYPSLSCESPIVNMLRKFGRLETQAGIVSFADALGPRPNSLDALHTLLTHPKAARIKEAFDLAEPVPEFVGEGEPTPLTDVWPGLSEYLPSHRKQCHLIRCERILVVGEPRECVLHTSDIYLVGAIDDDEPRNLKLVADELGLGLGQDRIQAVVQRRTPAEVEKRRSAIRQYSTDAERLLAAIGEVALRAGLPDSLLAVLENNGNSLTGIEIAEAAIATYHTDALRQYRYALDRFDPPSKWAGSLRAVEFVRSLGFSAEWAGERGRKRDPFVEVEGPYSLPELHDYQKEIAASVRRMLRGEYENGVERRGMISMPTGSGKTRVAVQAIVEAMRDDGFSGGVLWVADRDELCEQAVESWRQVWSSIGTQGLHLRISRMWAGQPRPAPTNQHHVIVATIQTLSAKLSDRRDDYAFLADFELVVFDEAHRSLAPTFTSVMEEIGLTRFRRENEPFVLGLTATPYRGRDEEETKRLIYRYGNKRLDAGAFSSDEPEAVIRELQDMEVLAEADHETIEGETFSLDAILGGSLDRDDWKQELDKWLALPWLPQGVEDRIARSAERTKRIVEAYEEHIEPDWPTLIFATSVEHAQTVAALLNRNGIRSRAVSGQTETPTRRRVVEQFRRGKIKALVNYGVFREGFDAPKTRAIIVARPVYSPNLYFQMIGRGLRGPKNGGDERCLILNVEDNIENFDRKLAFSELDWLWA